MGVVSKLTINLFEKNYIVTPTLSCKSGCPDDTIGAMLSTLLPPSRFSLIDFLLNNYFCAVKIMLTIVIKCEAGGN